MALQVAVHGRAPLSFPFSTWCNEIDEAKGAQDTAWLDEEKWGRWERRLLECIEREAASLDSATPGQ